MGAEARRKLSRFLAAAVIVASPIPFGAVDTLALAPLIIAMALSLALRPLEPGDAPALAPIGVVIGLLAMTAALALLQMRLAPPPPGSEMVGAAQTGMAAEIAAALGPSILFCLTFCRAVLMGASSDESRLPGNAALAAAALCAAYGVLALAFAPGYVLWREKTAFLGSVTGTFVNKNAAGALFALGVMLAALRLFATLRRAPLGAMTGRSRLHVLLHPSQRQARDLALAALLLVALLGSQSRVALAIGCAGAFVAVALYRKGDRAGSLGLPILLPLVAIGALALESFGRGVGARFDPSVLAEERRFEVYKTSLAMIAERPWLGFGLGSFADAFPAHRGADLGGLRVWSMAHSTPIEMAVEMGLPYLAALALAAAWLAVTMLPAARRGDRIAIAALTAGSMGLAHSFVDFPLQVPGYAVPFAAVVAAGVGRAAAARARGTETPRQANNS